MEQQVRFCTTSDGVRIAYAATGKGPPLVWVPGWLSHLELDLEFPPFQERTESLSEDFTLVRFDKRGTGLSQRGLSDISQEAHVLDIEAVVSALDLERFALVGYSEGGPICIAYTARHPDKVKHLILIGTWANGERSAGGREMQAALTSILKNEWGMGSRLLADLFFGEDAGPNVLQMFAHYQRQAATAEDAVRSAESLFQFDVTHLLPDIPTPTLVLHARSDRAAPIAAGQEIAAGIRGARFVSFDGHHVPNRKQMAQMDEAIREFVLGAAPRRTQTAVPSPSALVTVMFTDIEGSTSLTQRLGDARAQEILRAHNTVIRDALTAHNGSEIKHTGDGIMASFGSASRALECAIAIQRALAEGGQGADNRINVRIGLNAGEPVAEDRDLFGTAVQVAARVCAHAQPGQVLAANVVRELAAGKGFLFSDQGDTVLRGFEDPVRLYELRWGPDA